MIMEALAWVRDLSRNDVRIVGDKSFAVAPFKEIKPDPDPQPATMPLFTLSGLVDWVRQTNPKDALFRVCNPSLVELVSISCDQWGRRLTLASATKSRYDGFKFNAWLDHEEFCIALQQHFVPIDNEPGDFNYVAQVSANITAEAVVTSTNDGISQQVGIKRGLKSGLQDIKDLRRIVHLAPWRTFTEAAQPESPFVFRAKDAGDGNIPMLALFECDGGRWQAQAMESIKRFIDNANTGIPVIA